MLLLHSGGTVRVSLMPDAPFVIGRWSDCALVLVDNAVSRRHASIQLDGERVMLADEGSTNGTFINGRRLAHGELVPVEPGDVIDIGASRLIYGVESEISKGTTAILRRDPRETARPLADLLWDAHARADSAENRRDRADFGAIFASSPPEHRLRDSLAHIRRRLDASVAALFVPRGPTVSVGVKDPVNEGVAGLEGIANRAWVTRSGRIVGGVIPAIDGRDTRDTCADPYHSAVAVPLESGGELQGVLGVERVRRGRYQDSDLELVARLGERLIESLARERLLATLMRAAQEQGSEIHAPKP